MPTFSLMILFICGRVGSPLLPGLCSSCGEQGLLSGCGAQASHCGGFSCCGAQALEPQASVAGEHGLVAPWHVESSWTRDQTPSPGTGRQILIHCTTTEVSI